MMFRYLKLLWVFGLAAACAPSSPPSNVQNILFVGNSYTYQHDVPGKVAAQLNQDQTDGTQYRAKMVADGGQNLMHYVGDVRVLNLLDREDIDLIVLQDRSTATFYSQDYRDFFRAVSWFAERAQDEGAQLVLYQTWPRRAGHPFYSETGHRNFSPPRSPTEMRLKLAQTYQRAAKHHQAQLAPVGDCWIAHEDVASLYAADGSHASVIGADLAARALARTIAGHPDPCGS